MPCKASSADQRNPSRLRPTFRKITETSFPKAQQKENTVLFSFLRIIDSGLRFCYSSLVWLCVCVCSQFLQSCWLFLTPWTLVCQAPLSMGLLRARILEWVAMYSSRRSSWPRDQTHIFCISCISCGFFITEPLGRAVMIIKYWNMSCSGLLQWLSSKESACSAGATGDTGSVPQLGRDLGGGHGNPLSVLTWRIPWTQKPGGLWSIGLQRVQQDWSDLASKKSLPPVPEVPSSHPCLEKFSLGTTGVTMMVPSSLSSIV